MNPGQAAYRWLCPPMVGVLVAVMFIASAAPVTSQPVASNSTLVHYCSLYNVSNPVYFLSNLNTTLSSLRRQLATGERYATARALRNGESVWGLGSCSNYTSTVQCLSCFDAAVKLLKVCGLGNGAHAFYDDCNLRYENNNFYAEANLRAGVIICGNTTSSQPTQFRKAAEGLLSDLQTATPRIPNYFAISTRSVTTSNATVYALAECNLNLTQSVCLQCLKSRYGSLQSCLPKTLGKAIDNGCFMRYSSTPFFGRNQSTDIAPFLWNDDSNKKKSIIGGVIGGVSFLVLIIAYFIWRHGSRNARGSKQGKSTGSTDMLQGPAVYSYKDLQIATNDFNDEHKLGGGMFGEVYKGTLMDGVIVAVKKTTMESKRSKTYFDNELKIISNVHHRHLVRLLGYCSKGPLLFIVLEYMENGSLDNFLFGEKRGTLNWKQRFDIIFGTAKGLAYLHEQYHVTIIHKDIKTSNILIDEEYQPKISDFGLIRLLPEDKTHISTKLAGTIKSGYVAPEYAIHGQLSEKVDTYSFGVVVLEIISGKKYHDIKGNKSMTENLLDYAWNLYESGTHLNLIDDTLDPSEYVAEDVMKIIEIALMCTQSPASERPTMSEVVTLLSDKSLQERPPVRSTYPEDEVRIDVNTTISSASDATASISQLLGR